MTDEPFAERKHLTFAQAEGVEPLPSQLQLKEVSQELRALLWNVVHQSLDNGSDHNIYSRGLYFLDSWKTILYDKHVRYDHLMADDFANRPQDLIPKLKEIFEYGDYVKIFGFLQFVLQHRKCPYGFSQQINEALEASRAAYRVLDSNTIVPIGSAAEHATLERAFVDLASAEFNGARAHLRQAGEQLTAGNNAGSIRESIHAVESVARVLAPSGTLGAALASLEKSSSIHGGLKAGFNSIYGYSSDEQGLRHSLLDAADAKVDEVDALFMIGACASFVSYMINKARLAGLLAVVPH